MLEFAGAVDDGPDTNTVDQGPQRRAALTLVCAREQRFAETIGERARDALQQEDAAAPKERLEIGLGAVGRDTVPDTIDNLVGDRVGKWREQAANLTDHLEHLDEWDSDSNTFSGEREQRRAAHE